MTGRFWNSVFSTVMALSGKKIVPLESESLSEYLQMIFEGNISEVIRYLEAGEGPNMCDANKRTALQLAVEGGSVPVVEALLSHGATVNAVGFGGSTALHIAVHNSIDEVVQSNLQPGEEKTAMISCLLQAGADISLEDDEGETPVGIAEGYKSMKISALLISYA